MIPALLIFVVSMSVIALVPPSSGLKTPAVTGVRRLVLDRPGGAVLGALAMVLCRVVTPEEALHQAINYETLLLLLGMMVVGGYMIEARIFRYLSYLTLTHVGSARWLLVAVVLCSGLLSAVLVNDTVCLMTTPLVLACCRDARLRPLPFLLAVCFGANAGSAATPTGNPQNMIIGTLSGIPYSQFVLALGGPALLALAIVAGCLLWLFRRDLPPGPLPTLHLPRPPLDPELAGLCAGAFALCLVGFFAGYSLAWTALTAAGLLLVLGRRLPRQQLAQVDYVLLLFFAGLFVIVYGIGKAGVAQRLYAGLVPLLGTGPLRQLLVFGGFTVAVSQLCSNVPFVLLASKWMSSFADPPLMWLSTALVATLAGNLTIVGSVANIIVLESAGEDGKVSFWEFLRYGAIVTTASTLPAVALLYAERRWGLI